MAEATQDTPQQRNGHVDGQVETSHHPRTDAERQDQGYYGIPPVKEHTWTWEIPVYFWLGGDRLRGARDKHDSPAHGPQR